MLQNFDTDSAGRSCNSGASSARSRDTYRSDDDGIPVVCDADDDFDL